ncbi:hypothetical protein CDAR_600711 [Caerostris darwini]|uniref:Uncharacterized protein n=1 Tax=Caerostris darwini TaxID=1538125 RepID=A0AAV4TV52_9ARAC|nr:hypothetical protein CDAR_600711 [Caerostris darwini]
MEVDDDGRVEAAGNSPHQGSCQVLANQGGDTTAMTTKDMNTDLNLTTEIPIVNDAQRCQQLLQAEKEAAHQKTRYDAALGFVNVANIIADQDLLDKMSTAKMTKIALTKAEKEYKAALQRVTNQASQIHPRILTNHLDKSFAGSTSSRWLHLAGGKKVKRG